MKGSYVQMKDKITLKEACSIPNLLCYVRILLIPLFIWCYMTAVRPEDYYRAAGIIIASGLTDFLDGFIARKFNQVTELGKVIDPIADKLTQAAIAFVLVFRFEWMWMLLTVFVIKEITMAISCLVLLREGKKLDGALWYGKVCTAVFYFTMIILIAIPSLKLTSVNIFIAVATIMLLFAFLMYMLIFIRMKKQ